MANRRFGGGGGGIGGPQRGNRPFPQQQSFQGNNVNPWQGNSAPSNSLNTGMLSQLSAPQQIALALTSLLQPHQQQMNNNPPSLLSLNTSPAFSNQDHYDSTNRFGNRGRSDFRRSEPYNKNRGNNWRTETNRGGVQRLGQGGAGINKNVRPFNKDFKRKPAPGVVKPSLTKPADIKEEKPEENVNEEAKEEENAEKKRDWKDEKNSEQGEGKEEEEKEKGDNKREGRYYGVPTSLLHCFVCSKSMWDGESFQNHVRGKAHKQMLGSLEESFQITVNILRENMRLAEEKKMIELNRMNRNNRNFNRKVSEIHSTCNMCDLKFMGKIIVHRKTEGHQRLKRFLHPNCDVCKQEFPSRMEWIDHRFTPDHLRKLAETLDGKLGGEDGAIIEEDVEMDNEPLLQESLQTEDENPILELTDDMSNLQNRIPAYIKDRPVSTASLTPVSGFLCELCTRFFSSEEVAQQHLRSERHYYNFVEAVKNKYKRAATDKAEDDDGNWKRRKLDESESSIKQEDPSNGGEEMYDPEEACNEQEGDITMHSADTSQEQDNKWSDADNEITKGEEMKVDEGNEETAPKNIVNSPRTRRGGAAGGGAVRNGAGPKSKTRGRKQ